MAANTKGPPTQQDNRKAEESQVQCRINMLKQQVEDHELSVEQGDTDRGWVAVGKKIKAEVKQETEVLVNIQDEVGEYCGGCLSLPLLTEGTD